MSRKSKAKDQTKALNIPFTLTQADLVQEALAVAKDQTQALNIPVKVPLGGGRYAELLENRDDSYQSRCHYHYHSGKSCAVLHKWWTI
jgi:hypothetical protein